LELRAFLVESRHLSTPALLYGIAAGLAVPLLAITILTAEQRGNAIAAALGIAWMTLLPLSLMGSRVRRLMLAGFKRRDLVDAIEAELGRRREEIAFLYGAGPSRLERVLRRTAYAATLVAGTVVWVAVRGPELVPVGVSRPSLAVAVGVALLAAVGARWRTEHRTDPKRERRLRFWRGPLGRWMFRLAGVGLAARRGRALDTPPPASAPVSPDLSVGIVGDRFFDAPGEHAT